MNLNQIWPNNDYAYFSMKGRGETYRPNAVRVRIRRVYQAARPGNERMSGYAEVAFLHDDGTPKLDYNDQPRIDSVRARDIAMHWDEYIDERETRIAEAERLERERQERQQKEQEAKDCLLDKIVEKLGIPRDTVTSISTYEVRINRPGLERTLGLNGDK